MKKLAFRFLLVIPFLWAGMILAISFLEAPLKFQAPGVTIPIGIGIGNLVFHALNKVETVFLLALLSCYWLTDDKKQFSLTPVILLAILFCLQTFWLLPALDQRVALIQKGIAPAESYLHLYYILGESLKVILLAITGFRMVSYFRTPEECTLELM